MTGRLEETERLLTAAERGHADDAGTPQRAPVAAMVTDDVPTQIAMVRANLARTRGDAQPATAFAKRTLASDDPMARATAGWHLAQADWLGGRLAQAERTLTDVVAAYRAAGAPLQAAATGCELAQVQHGLGRLDAAVATCREALDLATAVHPTLPITGGVHVRLAEVLRERNELAGALDHATRGVAVCRPLPSAWPLASGLVTLAWIYQARGDPSSALQTMTEAQRVLPDPRVVELFNPAPVQAARLALAQGRASDAAHWVRECGLDAEDELSYPREREYLVLARVLLASTHPTGRSGCCSGCATWRSAKGARAASSSCGRCRRASMRRPGIGPPRWRPWPRR
jgi:LuxR family transcriptional regulator, maltose regulon positive regulatory protein